MCKVIEEQTGGNRETKEQTVADGGKVEKGVDARNLMGVYAKQRSKPTAEFGQISGTSADFELLGSTWFGRTSIQIAGTSKL